MKWSEISTKKHRKYRKQQVKSVQSYKQQQTYIHSAIFCLVRSVNLMQCISSVIVFYGLAANRGTFYKFASLTKRRHEGKPNLLFCIGKSGEKIILASRISICLYVCVVKHWRHMRTREYKQTKTGACVHDCG